MIRSAAAAVSLAAGTRAGAQARDKVSYAYQIDPMFEASLWALKNGKVRSDRIEVELTSLSIPALIQATTTRQYDIIQADTINVQRSADMGLPLVIMSTAIRYHPQGEGHHVWVARNSPAQSLQDLKGKKIAVPSLGSSGFNLLRFAVEEKLKVNLAPRGGDYTLVEMPAPQIEAALASGNVDAATLILSQNYRVARSGNFRAVATPARYMNELWGLRMIPSVNVSYPDRIAAKREALVELTRMMKASVDYMRANPNEVYAAVAREQNIDRAFFDTLASSYAESPNVLTADDRRAIVKLWELAHQKGLLKAEPVRDKFFWADAVTG